MFLFTPPPTPDDKAVPEPCIQHDTSRLPVSLLPKHFDAAAGPQHLWHDCGPGDGTFVRFDYGLVFYLRNGIWTLEQYLKIVGEVV